MLNKEAALSQIYCSLRHEWVANLPEENVRQKLIQRLTQELGYPLNCFAVEKSLHQMPHLALNQTPLPTRRADLVCFSKGIHSQFDLFPLLLIECKAVRLVPKVLHQAIGYNYYVKAPFLAVVNQFEERLGWYDKNSQEYVFISHLLSYEELLQKSKEV